MKDRILEFLRAENKTSSQFAEEIGVQPSSVSHNVSGRNKPSLVFVIKMLQTYTDLDTNWLIFGKGSMYGTGNQIDNRSESISEGMESLFDTEVQSEIKQDLASDIIESTVNEVEEDQGKAADKDGRISKVVLLYSDGTFKEYRS